MDNKYREWRVWSNSPLTEQEALSITKDYQETHEIEDFSCVKEARYYSTWKSYDPIERDRKKKIRELDFILFDI